MQQVTDFFKKLFDTADFPARWHCGTWTDFHGWLYIISDLLIWGAYFAIPTIIVHFVITKKKEVSFNSLYFLFASFILACGATHFVDALIFWNPVYRFSALLRLVTAIISWTTVFALIRVLPKAFSLRSPKEMEKEIELRKRAEEELKLKNRQLAEAERIAHICYGQWNLQNDTIILSEEGYNIYGMEKGLVFSFDRFISLIHPDDRRMVRNTINKILNTKNFENFTYRIIVNDKIKYIRLSGQLELDENGKVTKMIGTLQDFTDHWTQVERIRHQNEMLREISWIQSHKVRGPVATIMGLAELINEQNLSDPENLKIISGLKIATNDLDTVIKEIVKKSNASEQRA
jgi:PAS domain-containing protein